MSRLLELGCVIIRNDTGIPMTTLPVEHLALYQMLYRMVVNRDMAEAARISDMMMTKGVAM